MATIRIYIDGRGKGAERPVTFRITQGGLKVFVKTDWRIPPNFWDEAKECVTSKHPLHLSLNRSIIDMKSKLLEAELSLDPPYTVSEIKSRYLLLCGNPISGNDFLSYMQSCIDEFSALGKYPSRDHYKNSLEKVRVFTGGGKILFREITPKWLCRFYATLQSEGLSETTVYGIMKDLRSVFQRAIKDGQTSAENYPFSNFKIREPRVTGQQALSDPEIKKILDSLWEITPHTPIWNSTACFCCLYLCLGMRVKDLLELEWQNYDFKSRILQYRTSKSNKTKGFSFVVHETVHEVFTILSERKNSKYIFPFLAETNDMEQHHKNVRKWTIRINELLKKHAKSIGMERKITPHVARHSVNAKLRPLLNAAQRSDIFNHSSIKTTELYDKGFEMKNFLSETVRML